jgi:hypothetical protein
MILKFNFLKRSKKVIVVDNYNDERVIDVLTMEQIVKAMKWYKLHKDNINKIVADTEKIFAPSLFEDKNDPMIWKAEYWKWFLFKFGIIR